MDNLIIKAKAKATAKSKNTKKETQQINLETKHSEIVDSIKNKWIIQIENEKDPDRKCTLQAEYTKELNKYYTKALPCLVDYYSILNQENDRNNRSDNNCDNNYDNNDKNKENNNETSTLFIDVVNPAGIKSQKKTKANILEKFRLQFDPSFTYNKNDEQDVICTICGSNMTQSSTEGELVCVVCGNTKNAVLEGVKQTYRDIHTRQSTENYSYSKCGHLDFHLQKLQGKPVDLPAGMLDEIKKHMENDGVSPKNLTIKKMRVYLQIIKQTEFYEDANYIIECLGGPKAPKLDKDLNELVKSLFVRILVPFRKIKKTLFATTHNTDRRNLVIYNFILYKIFEMLKKEEFLKHLCLLKTSKINIQLEHFWYYTCKECNFEYVK